MAHAPMVCLLKAVLRSSGGGDSVEVGDDDLCAVLGRPLLCPALPGEARLECWAAAGHDAFLVDAARLFGLSLRALQPPRATRGLEQAAEFAQHFEASYLPFVAAALAHGQPVLAWSGPPRADIAGPGWVLVTRGGGGRGGTHGSRTLGGRPAPSRGGSAGKAARGRVRAPAGAALRRRGV